MSYQFIDKFFSHNSLVNSAAEAHGLATGMLCINGQAQSTAWIRQLFEEEAAPADEQARTLNLLFEETKESLESEDYDFEAFLPQEEGVTLSEQVIALIDWCQGFLFGVGSSYRAVEHSGQANEILQDIAEFTKLDPDAEGEEDEAAFIEITEFLRTAVLLLRAEFVSKRRPSIH